MSKNLYKQKQKEGLILVKKYDWQKISNQTRAVYIRAVRNRVRNSIII